MELGKKSHGLSVPCALPSPRSFVPQLAKLHSGGPCKRKVEEKPQPNAEGVPVNPLAGPTSPSSCGYEAPDVLSGSPPHRG